MTEGSQKGHTPLPPTCLRSDKLDYYGCDHEERQRRRWVARHSEYSTRMENDRGRGEGSASTRSDKRGRDTGHPGERRGTKKRTRRMARRMGETFTLRPKMKIVLLDALRRGQRTRHIISALALPALRRPRSALSLSIAINALVINNRSSDSSADSSQRESFENFDPPGSSGKHRTLGMVTIGWADS